MHEVQAMGDKTLARALAEECQVACVPGSKHATDTAEDAIRFVKDFGLPVILKAAMGGGGRGMRVVRSGAFPHASSLLCCLMSICNSANALMPQACSIQQLSAYAKLHRDLALDKRHVLLGCIQ